MQRYGKENPSKERPGESSAPALPAPAVSYIAAVIGVSLVASVLFVLQSPPQELRVVLVWTLVALVGEFMIFSTVTGRAHINLVTTIHLSMILVLAPGELLVVLWLSRCFAKFILKRQVWYRALFNVAQIGGAGVAAYLVYDLLGGSPVREFTAPALLAVTPAFLAAAAAYLTVNSLAVSGVVALTSADTVWRVWRENFGYAAELAGTAALVLLAPFLAMCYASLGIVGLLVFLLPAAFVRATSVRYIAMRRSQQDLIAFERLSAKGEIAADVGHKINNYLTAVSGRIQLLALKADKLDVSEMKHRLKTVGSELDRITSLSKELVEFSSKEARPAPTRITELVRNTIRFIQPQNRFDNVTFHLELDERLGEVQVDPGRLQQVVMNLLTNAANAMAVADSPRREISIWVRLHDMLGKFEITVADSGPGVPAEMRRQIFEPGFTTSSTGHGFGLSTTYRIVANHHGTIQVDESPSGGALFRVILPIPRKKAA